MTIFVINIGNVEYGKYSIPIIEKLCEYNNINLYILDKDISQNKYRNHPSWLKLFCHDLVNDDFIISWDLDLVPLKLYDIKSIFKLDSLNMVKDTSLLVEGGYNLKFRYNCGLMGIPKSFSEKFIEIYNKRAPFPLYPSYEQYYVNDYIYDNNIRINELELKYNYLYNDFNLLDRNDIMNLHFTWKIPNNNSLKSSLIKKIYENF